MSLTPHNWSPEVHQMSAITSPARFKVLMWHRKAHKTTLALNELIRWANAIPGTYWYVAPYRDQAKRTVWQDPEMLPKYVPPEIWENRNNSELYIPFPNGSILYIMGGDNPESLRGPNPKGVVLDEYDDMRPEVWSAIIQPIMAANPLAWTWFVGTPKGRRDLWKKLNYATETKKEWFGQRLRASETKIITAEALLSVRNDPNTPEDYYLQEYECECIEGAGTFFKGIDFCVYKGYIRPEKGHTYSIGVDLAKVNDFTVITPFDLNTFTVGKQERFNQIDWNLQKSRIEVAHLTWNRGRVRIDSTGVGDPIYEDLTYKIRSIEPFVFTEESRNDLLTNLRLLIVQGKIKIPADETLLNELKDFQYYLTVSKTGRPKTKIGIPGSGHDDCVMSLALAVWDAPKEVLKVQDNEKKQMLKEFDYFQSKRQGLTGSRYLKHRP